MDSIILFRVANELVGVDIGCVREVAEGHQPVFVPNTPDFLVGMVNIRGEVIPVISLHRRLGLADQEVANKLLIIEDKGRLAAIVVDELMGTRKINKKYINTRAELLSTKKEKRFFLGVYEGDKKPILLLDLGKTLSKEAT
ncbi:MAG: purine-binding chemotaxis protein CheW [candidate division WOR-3 bacterium]|nr:MAG: purine-binding chemotaxis protein CheW [candidate division WOR-3 bacterium]